MSPARLEPVGEQPGLGERLFSLSELSKEAQALAPHVQRDLGNSAPLAEGDPLPVGVECRLRPLVEPDDPGEVAVDDGGLASLALLERELERPPHVFDPVRVPKLAAGEAAPVERECRLG